VFFTGLISQAVDIETDEPGPGYFVQVPNELKLIFADCLDLDDINILVRTSRALNQLLTPYMYRRAKDGHSKLGKPYFLRAVDTGNLTAVRQFIEVGSSVNMQDTRNYDLKTALHRCAASGNIGIAQLLIQNGVKMSPAANGGTTPLHLAVRGSHPSKEMVTLLLDAGADISATCIYYHTVLYAAAVFGTASIVRLLLNRGADPTICKNGSTLLHWSAKFATAATVLLFLDAGVNVEAKNRCGETALHCAVEFHHLDMVKLLLERGANIHAMDDTGRTPLQELLKCNTWHDADTSIQHLLTGYECALLK
jgi:ankyrin repeat protein